MNRLLTMIDREVSQEDVARAVDIPINLRLAARTSKNFGSTQSAMNITANSARFAGVFLRAQDNPTPGILACFVDEMLAEAVVRPCAHCSCDLGADAPLPTSDHPLGAEF